MNSQSKDAHPQSRFHNQRSARREQRRQTQTMSSWPDVLGRLNLGVEVFQASGFQVRAQYGLQAGQNYLSQSLSANLVYRF